MAITIYDNEIDFSIDDFDFYLTYRGVFVRPTPNLPDLMNQDDFWSAYSTAERVRKAWINRQYFDKFYYSQFSQCRSIEDAEQIFTAMDEQRRNISAKNILQYVEPIQMAVDQWHVDSVYKFAAAAAWNILHPRWGYVYLIQAPGTGYWKIGRAKQVQSRMRKFEVNLPFEVHLEHTIKCGDYLIAERTLHRRYAHCRIAGTEFFTLSPEEIAEIKEIERL